MDGLHAEASPNLTLGAEATDTLVESQRLAAFAKFKPLYYWDETKKLVLSDGTKWRLLAEVDVEDSEESHFLGVINKWIEAAELIIPPVKNTTIIQDTISNSIESDGQVPPSTSETGFAVDNGTTYRRVRRALVPKREAKDAVLEEQVLVYKCESGTFARFTPCCDSPANIPFYYPQVHEFAFGHVECKSDIDTTSHESKCKLVVIAQELSPGSTVATKKHRLIWQDLTKRLYKWTVTERFGYQKRVLHDVVVDYESYVSKYQELKGKYAMHWVTNWPEQTDPRKFVYEDIAIASWIICFWTKKQQQGDGDCLSKPTFADLGCGNGLLVHLLNSEGFEGYGIDQCSRKVWCHFGQSIDLRAQTLVPYEFTANVDWIIGNHADELVPWIPIIAARSNSTRKPGFIAIPCCPHDLSGSKMTFPATAGQSKYHLYVSYIMDLATQCGFEVEKEYLRIPSTKNVAIIGQQSKEYASKTQNVLDFMLKGESVFTARVPDAVKNEIRLEKMRLRNSSVCATDSQ